MVKKAISVQKTAMNFVKNRNNETFTALINRLKPGLQSFTYRYIQDKDMINEVHKFQNETVRYKDEVDLWIESSVTMTTDSSPLTSHLYEHFLSFCKQSNLKHDISLQKFSRLLLQKMKDLYPDFNKTSYIRVISLVLVL